MKSLMKVLFTVVAIVSTVVSTLADHSGNATCSQGCHREQYWKVDGKCILADKITCCARSWAVAVGGTLTNTGANVDHWTYGDVCAALCPDKNDSVAIPFAPIESPEGLYGSWPECYCAPTGSGGGGIEAP